MLTLLWSIWALRCWSAIFWEHAYYLDYKNLQKDFLEEWLDKVVSWAFADKQFEAARYGSEDYCFPAPTT